MLLAMQFWEAVPQPNNADIFLQTVPSLTAFVSQFGGFLVDDITLSLKVKALKADLIANNETFADGETKFPNFSQAGQSLLSVSTS